MQYTEKDLFERLTALETEKLTIMDDLKQLKKDYTYNEETNTNGIDKEQVKLVAKAAIIHAKNVYEEQKEASDAVYQKYEELVGY